MALTQELEDFKNHLKSIIDSDIFPTEEDLQAFLDKSLQVMENEDSSYRPKDSESKPGGLLDFSKSQLPVVIIPDIHARADFLLKVLDLIVEEKTVLERLFEKSLIVICVGDAVHSERRGYERWLLAYNDWTNNIYAGKPMQQEMRENISTLQIIMELKNMFPENFHFLKGNHENILNENSCGNLAFRKFVQEGSMCKDFIRQVYGDVILHFLSLWEKSLPICAVFYDFGVSHAEPSAVFKKQKIIDYHKNADVILGLTWTANDEVTENTARKLLKELNPSAKRKGVVWFAGHRAIKDCKFLLRQNGDFLQLHNPDEMNVAIVVPSKIFNPNTDIQSVN